MSCSGRSSWDGAAAGVGGPPGAVLQPKKVSTPSTRRHTIVERVFISFPPIRSGIPDSRFKQNRILEFQNKNENEAHFKPSTSRGVDALMCGVIPQVVDPGDALKLRNFFSRISV